MDGVQGRSGQRIPVLRFGAEEGHPRQRVRQRLSLLVTRQDSGEGTYLRRKQQKCEILPFVEQSSERSLQSQFIDRSIFDHQQGQPRLRDSLSRFQRLPQVLEDFCLDPQLPPLGPPPCP